ncbi:hypothetical protein PTSG_01853 [Salpingoeca rosetta]|uniref:PX domain-containing protein n=1 Tax=Salpingoeca rosetta (strain ATCC 50818 / BSB-021) TaxID=946362 RepID=F2TZ52_SALR5|nr:uncharacterized protein PTSG_01853 [Salpingoeca rosetta]EGD78876.1 hypothetical protein PTSG_01853 [Salpingoeca rosetta]|eukprot:XP_004997832.1 hypothetical protein PTSG_01853 [Salpingoeca rosetta]
MLQETDQEDSSHVAAPQGDDVLNVKIADALNEQNKVKFYVHTTTTLPRFQKKDIQVVREHAEFVWLHDRFVESPTYAGLLIPPCPPKPDFQQSQQKLAKLQAHDSNMTPEEVEKLKQEIQSEYLAAFQKTVAMHEVFLKRLVSHPKFRDDHTLQVFLEYEQDLDCKLKSTREKALDFLRSKAKTFDSSFSSFKDADEFFDDQRSFITRYLLAIKEARSKAAQKTEKRMQLSVSFNRAGTELVHYGNLYDTDHPVGELIRLVGNVLRKCQTIEKRLATKEDLKLTDLLRYYEADANAAKDLMVRRIKCLQDKERADKALVKAQQTQKKVDECQQAATEAEERSISITDTARDELGAFQRRRVAAFRKGIMQYTQYQIRQAREKQHVWRQVIDALEQ